jgi:hypothetical protein
MCLQISIKNIKIMCKLILFSSCGWWNFKMQMIQSSIYSPGYIVVLKCVLSDGRIYIFGVCCYCDCRVEVTNKLSNSALGSYQ